MNDMNDKIDKETKKIIQPNNKDFLRSFRALNLY